MVPITRTFRAGPMDDAETPDLRGPMRFACTMPVTECQLAARPVVRRPSLPNVGGGREGQSVRLDGGMRAS